MSSATTAENKAMKTSHILQNSTQISRVNYFGGYASTTTSVYHFALKNSQIEKMARVNISFYF